MNKILFSFLCFCLTTPVWAQAIDCKQDLNCFIQAASKCSQAQMIIEGSFETADLIYKVKRQALIQGYNGSKCLYEDLVQMLAIDLPASQKAALQKQGWTEAIIQGQALSIARNLDLQKGLVRECEFSPDELETVLKQHFRDNKLDKEKWDTCKRRTLTTQTLLPSTPHHEEKVVEVNQEEAETEDEYEDEDEEVDTLLPEYLSFPHRFNALEYLQNSIAQISPLLGKKRVHSAVSSATSEDKSRIVNVPKDEVQAPQSEAEPLLIFKPTVGQYMAPTPTATPAQRYSGPYETYQKSFSQMSKHERLKLFINKKKVHTEKPRLYPQMAYEEMVKAGYTNEEIGDFVFKRIKEEKEALEKNPICSTGCPKGTYCQKMLKRCVQCSGPTDCPGNQICLNYQCVSGETVLGPEKKKPQ